MKCTQRDSDNNVCGMTAVGRYTWPGRDEAGICALHLATLAGIASAMGFHLQVIPVEGPPIGTIRCMSCGHQFAEAPQNWECGFCGGDVSQKMGEIHVPAARRNDQDAS